MNCPCGRDHTLDSRDFRAWLSTDREAQMMARAVLKSEDARREHCGMRVLARETKRDGTTLLHLEPLVRVELEPR